MAIINTTIARAVKKYHAQVTPEIPFDSFAVGLIVAETVSVWFIEKLTEGVADNVIVILFGGDRTDVALLDVEGKLVALAGGEIVGVDEFVGDGVTDCELNCAGGVCEIEGVIEAVGTTAHPAEDHILINN